MWNPSKGLLCSSCLVSVSALCLPPDWQAAEGDKNVRAESERQWQTHNRDTLQPVTALPSSHLHCDLWLYTQHSSVWLPKQYSDRVSGEGGNGLLFFFFISLVPADGDSTNAINGIILCSLAPNETNKGNINRYSCNMGETRTHEVLFFSINFSPFVLFLQHSLQKHTNMYVELNYINKHRVQRCAKNAFHIKLHYKCVLIQMCW